MNTSTGGDTDPAIPNTLLDRDFRPVTGSDRGYYLSFTLWHEAWNRPATVTRPTLEVRWASPDGTDISWAFTLDEWDRPGAEPELQLSVFGNDFAAYAAIPHFFVEVGAQRPTRLAEVAAILTSIGAVDDTVRSRPPLPPSSRWPRWASLRSKRHPSSTTHASTAEDHSSRRSSPSPNLPCTEETT